MPWIERTLRGLLLGVGLGVAITALTACISVEETDPIPAVVEPTTPTPALPYNALGYVGLGVVRTVQMDLTGDGLPETIVSDAFGPTGTFVPSGSFVSIYSGGQAVIEVIFRLGSVYLSPTESPQVRMVWVVDTSKANWWESPIDALSLAWDGLRFAPTRYPY
mgnify:CR=1 FL=1